MVMFTGLARVAEKTGYPVNEVSGWKTRGHGGMDSCQTIVIHHTAGANTGGDYNSYGTVLNGRPGLPGPLAQYGIGRNTGTINVFAAGRAWHAGRVGRTSWNNNNAIGIEIENNGTGEPYGSKTYGAAVALAGELVKEFRLTVNDVLGHKEVAVPKGRKVDPSFNMDKFRADVAAYINGGPQIVPVNDDINPIEKDWFDMATKADLKEALSELIPSIALEVWRYDQQGAKSQAWAYLQNPGYDVVREPFKNKTGKEYQLAAYLVNDNANIWEIRSIVMKLAEKVGLTADEIKAAVSEAIEESVVQVDVNVGNKNTPAG